MKPQLLIWFFLISGITLQAQSPHPILRYFNATLNADEVRLSWVITGGNTCSGIRIQRSDDGQSFQTIGEIDGVCGSPDVDVPYVFIDENPAANLLNVYRLELGTQGYTEVRTVEYVPLNDKGYNLRYDMITRQATVYLENSLNNRIDFILFSITGSKVAEGFTNGNRIFLDLSPHAAQIYLLRISRKNSIIPVKVPAF